MNRAIYDLLTRQKIILELPIGSLSDWESKTLFILQMTNIKILSNLRSKRGTFWIFRHLHVAFFCPVLADFLNQSFSAL